MRTPSLVSPTIDSTHSFEKVGDQLARILPVLDHGACKVVEEFIHFLGEQHAVLDPTVGNVQDLKLSSKLVQNLDEWLTVPTEERALRRCKIAVQHS